VFAATDSCPNSWPALHGGPAEHFDGNVSVLVGGSLRVAGSAAGAEGLVVTLGDAAFAREVPGSYEVGTTSLGSQVPPYANSDMLVVGGNLAGAPATQVDVGQGLGADVAVGGNVADGTDVATHGGRVDTDVAAVTKDYEDLAAQIAPKSVASAALAATGLASVTDSAITLTGDGVSDPQVFNLDGATLGVAAATGVGRTLQVLGVPDGAAVVVNLTGPAVDLDVEAVLSPDGTVVDPLADPYFANLATHLLWNAVSASTVDIGGVAQLPGSLLVPTSPSTTTLTGGGTNGRLLVAGDLVHTGAGQLHSYPYQPDPDLRCAPQRVPVGTLTLDLALEDPDHVVPDSRVFEGRFECRLEGDNVTPADDTWRMRAGAETRVLSDQVPVGAACTVTQRLDDPPSLAREWAESAIEPARVVVAKRQPRGFSVTNRVRPLPQIEDPPAPDPTPTPDPVVPDPPPVSEPPEPPEPPSTSIPEPTNAPQVPRPSDVPVPQPEATGGASPVGPAAGGHERAARGADPGPLTTTAPFTLRGSFVWGPMLMLSLLTLLVRIRRRPRHQRLH
jgi:choice-of-anchor A domain-containing protein